MNSNTTLDNLRSAPTTAQALSGDGNRLASRDELADSHTEAGSLNATNTERGTTAGFVVQTLQNVLKVARGNQGESTPVIPTSIQAVTVNGNWRVTFYFEDGDAYIVNYLDYH